MEKTKGNLSKAIELLRAYVDTFMMDREAWEELAELYLQVCCRLDKVCVHFNCSSLSTSLSSRRPFCWADRF